MDVRKIITLLGQKHDYKDLGEIFTEATQEEKSAIIQSLGLSSIINNNGEVISVYSADIISNKPLYITKDYDITLTANIYNFFSLVPSSEVTSYQWSRDSGNPAEDLAWRNGKTGASITLTKEDFTSRISSRNVTFTVTAVVKNQNITDSITFSKFQMLSKIQIKSSGNVFLDMAPNKLDFTFEADAEIASQRWYVNNILKTSLANYSLLFSDVAPGSYVTVKLEATTDTGEVLTDSMSIPRIKNGTNGVGIQGPRGQDGTSTYTWIKYADDNVGSGFSDFPIDVLGEPKSHIGMAYNKNTPNESNNPSDYVWSKYLGSNGIDGENGYMWVKYSEFYNGRDTNGDLDLHDVPYITEADGGREYFTYIGMAYNKETKEESNVPEDYTWSKIQGEDGVSSFTSIVFKRSPDNTPITQRPTGGTYEDPVPTGWSDGIPSGNGVVYQSSRIFSSDGLFPQDDWSFPSIAIDNQNKDYEYSNLATKPANPTVSPSSWHNTPQEGDIWQAVRNNNNGIFGPWTILQIKGEKGAPGANGHSGYMLELSNDNISVPANPDGTFSNPAVALSLAKTNLVVYYGNEVLPRTEYDMLIQASTGVGYTTSDSNHTIQITSLSVDVGQIVIDIFPSNDRSRRIARNTFNISKVKGSSTYEILASTSAIKVNTNAGASQTILPTSIEVRVKRNTGSTVEYITTGRMTYRYIYTSTVGTDEDGNPYTIDSLLNISNAGDPLFIEFKYFDPVSNLLVDRERIPFVRDGVNGLTTEFRYAKNSDPLTPPAIDINATVPAGWSTTFPAVTVTEIMWVTKATKYHQGGALVGQWAIPTRFSGTAGAPGSQGDPGLPGTTGPIPRMFEWKPGAVYLNGPKYIDYIYYRSTVSSEEGWYTVKRGMPGNTDASATANAVGAPNNNFFKENFTALGTFGTIIAEQANLGGFIFRNGVLVSQSGANNSQCHVDYPGAHQPNLTLDGSPSGGFIKFLDRMIMSKEGILLKDDCGKVRMAFQWQGGVPILKFWDENGKPTWEAGKSGYNEVYVNIVPASWEPLKAKFKATAPNGSTSEGNSIFLSSGALVCQVQNSLSPTGLQYYHILPEQLIGYTYNKGIKPNFTTQELESHGKIYTQNSLGTSFIADGYYMYSFYTYRGDKGLGERDYIKATWFRVISGVAQAPFEIDYDAPMQANQCTQDQMNMWFTNN